MRRLEILLVIGVLCALAAGMGACGNSDSAATVTQTKTVVERAPAPSSSDSPSGSGSDPGGGGHSGGGSDSGGGSWTMPDLIGKDLQGAQDEIQSLTDDEVFFTDSHDVSGEDRSQILDRDWQVCTQDPAPGEKLTPDTNVDFGVVRVSEQCP
jgi:hypothetical protein